MATKHEMAQTTGQGEQSNFPMLAGKKQTVIPLPQLLNSKRAKMQTFKKGKETGTTDRYCTEPINREPNQEGCVMEDGRVDRYIYTVSQCAHAFLSARVLTLVCHKPQHVKVAFPTAVQLRESTNMYKRQ